MFVYLLEKFPSGILSLVMDTFDLWRAITEYCVKAKDIILARDGKLVIRPDSGDPVDILCGLPKAIENGWDGPEESVIELLWDVFGGTTSSTGYKVLDSHIGAIYGDSINYDRAKRIFERLEDKGFASTNVVLGIGSYSLQFVTRDTHGSAQKQHTLKSEKLVSKYLKIQLLMMVSKVCKRFINGLRRRW
jgi:nicotinamide phosphoribosyltransferase